MAVELIHAQHPDGTGGFRAKRSSHPSVRKAVKAVHTHYADKWGWWYQIYQDGREVYSSDHELAGLPIPGVTSLWQHLCAFIQGKHHA